MYALDASSIRAVLGACLPPCSMLTVHLVDPILEGALAALCNARGLQVTAREDQVRLPAFRGHLVSVAFTRILINVVSACPWYALTQVLYATPSSVNAPRVPKHPRERSDLQVLPLPGDDGLKSDHRCGIGKLAGGPQGVGSVGAVCHYGLFCEGNRIGTISISPHGQVESIAVDAGYQGRGFEGYMVNEILEAYRRRSGRNIRPHFWIPRGEEGREDSSLSTLLKLPLGFEPVAEAATLHACKK